jgi:hypothetical protein
MSCCPRYGNGSLRSQEAVTISFKPHEEVRAVMTLRRAHDPGERSQSGNNKPLPAARLTASATFAALVVFLDGIAAA